MMRGLRCGTAVLALLLATDAAAGAQELAGGVSVPGEGTSRPVEREAAVGWPSLHVPAIVFTPPDEQAAQPLPTPRHTGFKALLFETGADFKAFPTRRSTWTILAIGGGAAALARPGDEYVNTHIVGSRGVGRFFTPGKYIGYTHLQLGAAFGLYATGRYLLPRVTGGPKTNKVSHLGFDLVRAIVVSQAVTQGIKIAVRRDRPTGECCAFPSGHAATTFATASVLERHFGYRGAWPTFLVAAYVAASRLHDNRHFLSDVMFGASVGIATGWTVVGRHGRSEYALAPAPTRGGVMVALVRRPSRQ